MSLVSLIDNWGFLIKLANERYSQKKNYKSSSFLTHGTNTHIAGLCGEMAVKKVWPDIEIDWGLKPKGDGGYDFEKWGYTWDIKTTKYFKNPYLKVERHNKADYFILCALDEKEKLVNIVGYASRKQVFKYKPESFGGPNKLYYLKDSWFKKTGQEGLPLKQKKEWWI